MEPSSSNSENEEEMLTWQEMAGMGKGWRKDHFVGGLFLAQIVQYQQVSVYIAVKDTVPIITRLIALDRPAK